MEYTKLNNGVSMPAAGLGVYNIPKRDTQRIAEEALETGCRLIDTAAYYGNEREVGAAVRASGVPRAEIFVTTKICDPCFTENDTLESVKRSMQELGLEYADLMLIHWPAGRPRVMWKTLEKLCRDGIFRAIGVSNFYPGTFSEIAKDAEILPAVNQLEASVLYQQRAMAEYLAPFKTALQAWSPLAEGRHGICSHPLLQAIGARHGKSAAQAALRYLLQLGIAVIPKSSHIERIRENLSLFDFALSAEELSQIRALDTGRSVTGWPGDALSYIP